jgi:hypothetical protein
MSLADAIAMRASVRRLAQLSRPRHASRIGGREVPRRLPLGKHDLERDRLCEGVLQRHVALFDRHRMVCGAAELFVVHAALSPRKRAAVVGNRDPAMSAPRGTRRRRR